ncbi:MAG: cyclic nucleotide-binding domain-containing protein [Deltaproteobacteria bacterium]|nr:MAG: cyclic nucleotide-binding domain-containing protein [Deltaproteobacteria bacterium]
MNPNDIVENKLEGESISTEALLKISIFEGVPPALLEKNRGAVVRRRFRKGDIICREGDYGSTAFYILNGKAKVFINTPFSHVSTSSQKNLGLALQGLSAK